MVRLKDFESFFDTAYQDGFNSKVVRLKAKSLNDYYQEQARFNSKVVRLKVGNRGTPCNTAFRFNSKVVRLKANVT